MTTTQEKQLKNNIVGDDKKMLEYVPGLYECFLDGSEYQVEDCERLQGMPFCFLSLQM